MAKRLKLQRKSFMELAKPIMINFIINLRFSSFKKSDWLTEIFLTNKSAKSKSVKQIYGKFLLYRIVAWFKS